MKQISIPSEFFSNNRKNIVSKLKPNSVAVCNANDTMPTNADGQMIYRQNSDLFYLTGINQEETVLFISPDAYLTENREILFIKYTNEHISIWEGEKLSLAKASQISGIKKVLYLHDMERTIYPLIYDAEHIYLNTNEHTRAYHEVTTRDERFITLIKQKFPLHKIERLAPILHILRSIKHQEELKLIKEAISITERAFYSILNIVKPGIAEYEIEAQIIYEFIKSGALGHAYQPIIASGIDSCTLHYTHNHKICEAGQILLCDFGACYANYNADLTRVLPVNGKFTPRQAQVYQAVLRIQKYAISLLKPANNFVEYQKSVGKCAEEELISLGLITKSEIEKQDPEKPLYKKYFMHGASHYLGLDVHDVGNRYATFAQGMVLTCEPGIYIRDEKIGIRLENNILITSNGNIDLTSSIPIALKDIEDSMKIVNS
ncbi:MAG: aminopeptidase P N-terminal domain-containing protein [Cytophagales bacterium]|nr:aminopeptidase P N-terminal domain-containing protein [Cytophagales bacterium]